MGSIENIEEPLIEQVDAQLATIVADPFDTPLARAIRERAGLAAYVERMREKHFPAA